MIFGIRKMPSLNHDYFRYLPYSPDCQPWGLTVTAAGYTEIRPCASYPPVRHPDDHHLDWTSGRTLSSLQIVSIQAGKGWFESKPTGRKRIQSGSAFLVMPGVWHRYRPDPSTGWTESWVEMSGTAVVRLIQAGIFEKAHAFKKGVAVTKLDEALNSLHVRLRNAAVCFDPAILACGYEILAAWAGVDRESVAENTGARKIAKAEHLLSSRYCEPINMASLARSLGIAYSHFRKLFREHTGYAPWAYVLRLRLVRARRLLLQSNATLTEIADEIGFSSAFHFSAAFKDAFGESPNSWRVKHARRHRRIPRRESKPKPGD